MTYQEALEYLNSFLDYERQDSYDYNRSFKLERMRDLASLLGNPHQAVRSIHIAGTKGKGSTCAFIYSILRSAGFRVGLYTSPHLVSYRERIRIDDRLISEEDIARLLEKVKAAVNAMKDARPSFFEVFTAVCYLYFKEEKVDFGVYEVGLGGRLDATNIIDPLVSAITPISYEHTDKLGRTLSAIASEKAGIVKELGICVSAPQAREAEDIIKEICDKRNARLIRVGQEIRFKELSATDEMESFEVSGLFDRYDDLKTTLLGPHQVLNAAVAIGIIEALRFKGVKVSRTAIRDGIGGARWDGRLEVLRKRPFMIVDGAQNRASAAALAVAIKRFEYKRLLLVLGVSKDKDIEGVLEELLPGTDILILTKSRVVERALAPSEIKRAVDNTEYKETPAIITSSVEEALDRASSLADGNDMILITGSLFVVGEARERWMTQSQRYRRR